MSSTSPLALPLLDLARFDASPEERAAFLAELRSAARDTGFFYLTGHGIPEQQVRQVIDESRHFFALPEDDKRAIEMVHSPHFRGYTAAGRELTRGRPDWREQLDLGAERPALNPPPEAPAWRRLQGPNQWPLAQPSLRPALIGWQDAVTGVAIRLLRAFAAALEQPEHIFDDAFAKAPIQHLKIIRYPGLAEPAADEQGVGAHKDSGFLTLLLQDEQAGLEVETADGWIGVPPLPGSFVVNIGESLELASNGYLRATVHRVSSPPAGRDRLSVAFFLGPRLDATVPLLPLPDYLAAEAPGPATDPANPIFYEVGWNMLKGRLRSHPDVAERHYADLLKASA